ncbi:hypothetical protein [Sediminicola luteus]|uniref:hypothetical protein n=1 Tax=Sediminicola luteus TaxID=319238 RepID=UPI000BE54987|nr:hypothetical protein [Sediminicola luteus]
MTKLFRILFIALFIIGCDSEDTQRNPYLQELGFRFDINTNLPLYSPLTNTGNALYFPEHNGGIRGFFVMNLGFDNYIAFEASCPNHAPNDCSTMKLNGSTVICSCEDYEYTLANGLMINRPDGIKVYDLLNYRTQVSGNVISVFN